MGSNRNKKLVHKLSYIGYEQDEVLELIKEYYEKFCVDFEEEIKFKNLSQSDEPLLYPEDGQHSTTPKTTKAFHSLFRAIARKTHPDHHGDEYEEEFKKANEAYDGGKWETLIKIAGTLKMDDIEFSDEEAHLIEERIACIDLDMQDRRDSPAWIWSTMPMESGELKKRIRAAIGIDEEEFLEFLRKEKV